MMRLSLSGRSSRSLNFLLLLAPDHRPALELGNRTTLLDPYQIADGVRIGLLMPMVFFRAADRFLHRGVRKTPIDAHDNGLVLLVADDHALERTLRHLEPLIPSTLSWRATSASQRPSVWRISSSSRPFQPSARVQPPPPAPASPRVSARRLSSCARYRGGSHAPATCSRADRLPAGSADLSALSAA